MSRIFLSQLPSWITTEILIAKFSHFGIITDVKIIKNKFGKNKNFGYIGFFDNISVEKAISNSKYCFLGYKKILIQIANPRKSFNILKNPKLRKNDNKVPNKNNFNLIEKKKNLEVVSSSGKIFLRNIPIQSSESDLRNLLESFGFIESIYFMSKIYKKKISKKAIISFGIPECAIKASALIDGNIFRGRILHVLNFFNKSNKLLKTKNEVLFSKFKKILKKEEYKQIFYNKSWFTYFIPPHKIIKNMLIKFGPTLKIFKNYQRINLNLGKFAICEARMQNEIRTVFKKQGIDIWSFNPNLMLKKSKRIFFIKNLSHNNLNILKNSLKKFGKIVKFIYIHFANFSLIEYQKKKDALEAYLFLENFGKNNQKYLIEWAPLNSENNLFINESIINQNKNYLILKTKHKDENLSNIKDNFNLLAFGENIFFKNHNYCEKNEKKTGKILIKNIPFQIKLKHLKTVFEKTGKIISIRIPKKNPNQHRGFAFIHYKNFDEAKKTVLLSQNIHLLSRHLSVNLLKEN
jgi:multiple RNA-binding domain-containing protein 1